MKIPIAVEKIIAKLENAGYEAYAVGGCVRDSLLGRIPDDWDITTSALPEEVKRLFRRTIDTGIQHGTVTVLMSGSDSILRGEQGYEVTTYRIDGDYLDGRHPSKVSFTPSLHEDLARRDFTINAMAYNDRSGIVDDFEGMQDLEKRQIRAVGEAEHRFQEDALRMLRALRFSAQLSFTIEAKTYEAVKKLAENLRNVSKERIQVELSKLLLSENPEHYRMIFDTGLAPFMTEHFPLLTGSEGNEVYPTMPNCAPKKKYLRYGMLLRNVPDCAAKILRELKLDNETIRMGKSIAELHQKAFPETETEVRKLLSQYGTEIITDWIKMEKALLQDKQNQENSETDLGKQAEEGISKLCRAEELTERILTRGDCLSIGELAVNGQDLMQAGIEKGPKLGESLRKLLEMVLEEPERNQRELLLEELQKENIMA